MALGRHLPSQSRLLNIHEESLDNEKLGNLFIKSDITDYCFYSCSAEGHLGLREGKGWPFVTARVEGGR
jgi:hypothetical protein